MVLDTCFTVDIKSSEDAEFPEIVNVFVTVRGFSFAARKRKPSRSPLV